MVLHTLFPNVRTKFTNIGTKKNNIAATMRRRKFFWAFFISSVPENIALEKSRIPYPIKIIGIAIYLIFKYLFIFFKSSSPNKSSHPFIGS